MGKLIYSPKIGTYIVILDGGEPSMGCVACYTPKEIESLDGTKPDVLKIITEHKKLWDLKEGEWRIDKDTGRFLHPNAKVQDVPAGEDGDGFREEPQDLLPVQTALFPEAGDGTSESNGAASGS